MTFSLHYPAVQRGQLTPSEAFDLAEKLLRGRIRHVMLDDSAKVLLKGEEGGVAFEHDTHPAVSG